jgi:hypothetical protein
MRILFLLAAVLGAASLSAQQPAGTPAIPATALSIYNENFAVARTQVDLDLKPGLNEVTTSQVTTQLEPDSVVLRDPSLRKSQVKPSFRIVEQDYDAAVVTQDWLLRKYEGKTIDFAIGGWGSADGHTVSVPSVPGKIVRAPALAGQYQQGQPLIEVGGQMQFALPGAPLFPASTDGLLLKPTLRWQIDSEKAQKVSAELAYITGGLSWEATYNIVAPDADDASGKIAATGSAQEKAEVLGWVTIHNHSGTDFAMARIKLMAGDVAKISPRIYGNTNVQVYATGQDAAVIGAVTQKAFDDFHLYDLNRTTSLRDGEIKQVQFIEASGVALNRTYVYDGSGQNIQSYSAYSGNFNRDQNYGLNSGTTKVQIFDEFKNSESNHLGIPLPAGRIRLYRRDADGQMEFVGESTIDHTPSEDTVKISTGNAFDIKGTRRQTDFSIDQSRHSLDETFEIKLANQKAEPARINVVEHLYRGENWQIEHKSADFTKLDSHNIQFPVDVPAKGDVTLTYSVHYSW